MHLFVQYYCASEALIIFHLMGLDVFYYFQLATQPK